MVMGMNGEGSLSVTSSGHWNKPEYSQSDSETYTQRRWEGVVFGGHRVFMHKVLVFALFSPPCYFSLLVSPLQQSCKHVFLLITEVLATEKLKIKTKNKAPLGLSRTYLGNSEIRRWWNENLLFPTQHCKTSKAPRSINCSRCNWNVFKLFNER